MILKSGYRFPACANPWQALAIWLDASAGKDKSDKIMPKKV
jgi:hypothetical protein